jgi:APA family basic amino acid/polyamine antiporter
VTTPSGRAASRAGAEASLVRAVGTWALAASIVNVTVGGGIFRVPAEMAILLGPAAPLAYLVCAAAMGLIVLCIAEAGSRVSLTGGPYAYIEVAFGPFVGFLGGVLLWLVATFAMAGVSSIYLDALAGLVPGASGIAARGALLAASFAIACAINIRGVRQGARFNALVTVAKLLPILLLVVAGIAFVRPAHLSMDAAGTGAGIGEVARASVVLIFAFAGIESALVPSGEVREPARSVPRAIFIAMLGITLLYIAVQLVVQGVLGAQLRSDAVRAAPLAAAAEIVLGSWGRTLLLAGAVVSTFGYLSGMTLAVPRALFAFARDGFLPRALATVHPRRRSPWVAIVVQAAIVWALAVSTPFLNLAVRANIATLLLYAGCCIASWALRRRGVRAEGAAPFRVPAAGVVPLLACGVIAVLLWNTEPGEWAVVLVVLAVAAAIFALTRGSRRRLAAAAGDVA